MDIPILAEEFFQYSLHFKGLSNKTISRYRQAISFFCRSVGIHTIEEISQENLRAFFYKGRIDLKWQTMTYQSYHKSLMVFIKWCLRQGYMQSNPLLNVEIPKLEKKLPYKLTKQQSLYLLDLVFNYPYSYRFERYRNHAMFATLIFAGLRKKELLSLRMQDVDLENLTLFVYQGKGAKDRVMPISFVLAQILKRYIGERKRLHKTCPEFFTTLKGNKGFTDQGLKRIVGKMQQASGFPFTLHKLRHTFATLMLEGGCDIYSLSRMMGHNDIKTTTIYLSASAEHLRDQMTKHPLNAKDLGLLRYSRVA